MFLEGIYAEKAVIVTGMVGMTDAMVHDDTGTACCCHITYPLSYPAKHYICIYKIFYVVSVLLPTYNRAHLLGETIQSVLQQEYKELELLVLDDGSEDGTKDLVLAIRDPRVKYLPFPLTGHTGRLKNAGIRQSSGQYIAFIDSDDTWKPGKLVKQLELLECNPGIGFSITDVTTFRDETVLIDRT